MAFVVNDRVQETTISTGTSTINLAGAVTGFESFVSGIGNGNSTYYAIQEGNQFEVGTGTVTSGSPNTLSRTTVFSSSNSDNLVNFSAGTKNVFCTLPASKAVLVNTSNNVIVGNNNTNTAITTRGTGDITISTNEGTNSGSISIADGVNGDITIAANGTGQIIVNAGAVGTPTIAPTGDTNTGIFFSAADTIDFTEGGVATGQFDSSGNFKFNSGYGSVATAYGCRAWVNFNGTGTPAIREDGNVTSITDGGTGIFTVNFTIAMPDVNYCLVGACKQTANTTGQNSIVAPAILNTTSIQITTQGGSTLQDMVNTNVSVFR
jgi:hypothetical protein